jgi:hypothetical protein
MRREANRRCKNKRKTETLVHLTEDAKFSIFWKKRAAQGRRSNFTTTSASAAWGEQDFDGAREKSYQQDDISRFEATKGLAAKERKSYR